MQSNDEATAINSHLFTARERLSQLLEECAVLSNHIGSITSRGGAAASAAGETTAAASSAGGGGGGGGCVLLRSLGEHLAAKEAALLAAKGAVSAAEAQLSALRTRLRKDQVLPAVEQALTQVGEKGWWRCGTKAMPCTLLAALAAAMVAHSMPWVQLLASLFTGAPQTRLKGVVILMRSRQHQGLVPKSTVTMFSTAWYVSGIPSWRILSCQGVRTYLCVIQVHMLPWLLFSPTGASGAKHGAICPGACTQRCRC